MILLGTAILVEWLMRSDVRKSAFLNIEVSTNNKKLFIQRCRDSDSSIRRSFYSARSIKQLGDFKTQLSTEQREFILQSGLNDRFAC